MRSAGCSPVSHVPYVPASLSEGAPPRAEGPLILRNVMPRTALGKYPPAGRACREHGPSCRTCAQCHYRRALCCHCSRASSRRMRSICRP